MIEVSLFETEVGAAKKKATVQSLDCAAALD